MIENKSNEMSFVRINKKILERHKELVKKKYNGKILNVVTIELDRAVENHCKLLEVEIKKKKKN